MTLFVVTVLMVLGLALGSSASTELRVARQHRDETAAFYVAEAGLRRALAQLDLDPSWREGFSGVEFGTGHYTVVVEELDGAVVYVTSTGSVGGAERTIQVVAELVSGPGSQKALYSGSSLDISGRLQVEGDVLVAGDITGSERIDVDGELALTGEWLYEGKQYSPEPVVVEPIFVAQPPGDWYREGADQVWEGGVTLDGNLEFDGELIYVQGDLNLSGQVEGTAVIVAEGTLTVDGNLKTRGSDSVLVLISLEEILLQGGGQVEAFLYSYGGLTVDRSVSQVRGGIVAGHLSYENELKIISESGVSLSQLPGYPDRSWQVLSWKEIP